MQYYVPYPNVVGSDAEQKKYLFMQKKFNSDLFFNY